MRKCSVPACKIMSTREFPQHLVQSFCGVGEFSLYSLCVFNFAAAHFVNVSFLFPEVALCISEFTVCWFVFCSTSVAVVCLWQLGRGIQNSSEILLGTSPLLQLINCCGRRILQVFCFFFSHLHLLSYFESFVECQIWLC